LILLLLDIKSVKDNLKNSLVGCGTTGEFFVVLNNLSKNHFEKILIYDKNGLRRKIMQKVKISLMLLCVGLITVLCTHFVLGGRNFDRLTRSVESNLDHLAMLQMFDRYEWTLTENALVLETEKSIPLFFSELDLLGYGGMEQETLHTTFISAYCVVENLVHLTMQLWSRDGELVHWEILTGVAFYDDSGTVDTVFNVDGEFVLMSEMMKATTLDNLFLRRAIRSVANAVSNAVTTVVNTVANVVVNAAATTVNAMVNTAANPAQNSGNMTGSITITVGAGILIFGGLILATLALAQAGVGVISVVDVITDPLVDVLANVERLLITTALLLTMPRGVFFPAMVGGDALGRNGFFMIPTPINEPVAITRMATGGDMGGIATLMMTDAQRVATTVAAMFGRGIALDGPHGTGNAPGFFPHFHVEGRPFPSGHSWFRNFN